MKISRLQVARDECSSNNRCIIGEHLFMRADQFDMLSAVERSLTVLPRLRNPYCFIVHFVELLVNCPTLLCLFLRGINDHHNRICPLSARFAHSSHASPVALDHIYSFAAIVIPIMIPILSRISSCRTSTTNFVALRCAMNTQSEERQSSVRTIPEISVRVNPSLACAFCLCALCGLSHVPLFD